MAYSYVTMSKCEGVNNSVVKVKNLFRVQSLEIWQRATEVGDELCNLADKL